MALPISSSDLPPEWGRWLAVCIGALAAGLLLLFALVLLVDPYDSGRFGLLGIEGVDDGTPDRDRQPCTRCNFDSAVIGNSTAQMLKPAELSQATGLRFVQLYVPAPVPASSSPCSISSCATMRASARWCSLLTPGGAPIIQSNCRWRVSVLALW